MPSYNDWLVSVPLSQLLELKQSADEYEKMKAENNQLRNEIEGLRRVQTDFMIVFGDLKRSLGVSR